MGDEPGRPAGAQYGGQPLSNMSARLWTLLVIVVAVILAVVGSVVLSRIESRWEDLLADLDKVQEQLEVRPGERPVLWGEPEDGRAFDDYDKAMQLMATINAELEAMGDDAPRGYVEGEESWWDPETAPAACWQIVARLGPAYAHIRRGAHKRDRRRRIAWRSGYEGVLPNDMGELPRLQQYATLRIWQLIDVGDQVEGVRTLLDMMQFGHDCYSDPVAIFSLVGAGMLRFPLSLFVVREDGETGSKGTRPDISLAQLSQETRRLLGNGLARLDDALPAMGNRFRCDACLLRWQAAMPDLTKAGEAPLLSNLMGRRLVAGAVEELLAAAGEYDALQGPWRSRQVHYDAWVAKVEDSPNPLFKALAPNVKTIAESEHEVQLWIRVVRMAVFEASGEPQVLDDPFGGKVKRAIVDGRTRYWSCGPDGIDHRGDVEQDIVFRR